MVRYMPMASSNFCWVNERVGGGELLLQILGGRRPRRPAGGRTIAFGRVNDERRLRRPGPLTMFSSVNWAWNPGASAMNVHSPRARPIIANRPLSSVAAVKRAERRVGILGADRRALDRLAALVLDDAADAGDLRCGGRRSHDESDGDERTEMATHRCRPLRSVIPRLIACQYI